MNDKHGFPLDFPKSLMEKAIDLGRTHSEGCYGFAWKKDDITKVIEFLGERGFVILGGDAYLLKYDVLEFLGDNWYYKKKIKNEKIIEESVKQARNYILFYISKNGEDNSYFSITFRLLEDYKILYNNIKEIVYGWNPIGLVSFPKDEYDPESYQIYQSAKKMIEDGNFQEETLANKIKEVFILNFRDEFKCDFEECLSIALKIKYQV